MVHSTEGKHPKYYEAILQLRDCLNEVVVFAREGLISGGISIVKEVKVAGGVDFYVADKNFAKALGKKLREKFGGEVKITASLWGQKDGKDVYRQTILFRCSGINKGDLVEYEGEQYKVKMMLDKEVMLQHTKTGEKVHVKYKDADRVKKVDSQ